MHRNAVAVIHPWNPGNRFCFLRAFGSDQYDQRDLLVGCTTNGGDIEATDMHSPSQQWSILWSSSSAAVLINAWPRDSRRSPRHGWTTPVKASSTSPEGELQFPE